MTTLGKKILIVDDEEDILAMVRMALESRGYDVVTARDGEEALRKARQEGPHVIVLDIVMPKLNGYQVCREIKKDESTRAIPVIMLTAKAEESDRFWGTETGADGYLTKPFDMQDLLKKIQELLPD